MSWCWCLRVLGADCWNDLQVVVIRILVNWCAVIGWIGEPAVLCHMAFILSFNLYMLSFKKMYTLHLYFILTFLYFRV